MMYLSTSSSSGIESEGDDGGRPFRRRHRRKSRHNIWRLMQEYISHDEKFENIFGLSRVDFERLQSMILYDLEKKHTRFRHMSPMRPRDRLCIFLRFLASGWTFDVLGNNYHLNPAIIETIALEVCNSVYQYLRQLVMPEPTKKLWKHIASGFKRKHMMPNCLGSLHGRYLTVQHKRSVLLSLVDSQEKFVIVDVGDYGTDEHLIWDRSTMGALFEENELDVPVDKSPRKNAEPLPYVIIGGNSFVLKPYLLSKFMDSEAEDYGANKVFNCRIDPVKRTAEAAVARLQRRWQILQRNMPVPIETAKKIIMTICCIENYFSSPEMGIEFPPDLEMTENEIALLRQQLPTENLTTKEKFIKYFLSKHGQVPWQYGLVQNAE